MRILATYLADHRCVKIIGCVYIIIIIIINYCTDLNYEYDVQSYLFIYIN